MRIQRVALEHHGDVPVARRALGHIDPADRHGAAGHFLQAGDHAQERRLPAARGADEHDELAVGDLETDVVNGDDVAGEHFRDPVEADVGHGGLPAYSIQSKSGIDHWASLCIDWAHGADRSGRADHGGARRQRRHRPPDVTRARRADERRGRARGAGRSRSVCADRRDDRRRRRAPRGRRPAALRRRRLLGRDRGARCGRVRDDVRAPARQGGGDRRRRGTRVRRRARRCRGRRRGRCQGRRRCSRDRGRRRAGHQRERAHAVRRRSHRGGCGRRRADGSRRLGARLAARARSSTTRSSSSSAPSSSPARRA